MERAALLKLLKRVFEIAMPDLRKQYRIMRLAKVVRSYAAEGDYWADVQILKNDGSDDESEPVITEVAIPVMWGGSGCGIVCPPAEGCLCDLSFYNGDPGFPVISNFRYESGSAVACDLGALVIQQEDGVFIKIDGDKNIKIETTADVEVVAGTSVKMTAPEIVMNDGDGVTGVVRGKDVCFYNGNNHLCSATVKAGD